MKQETIQIDQHEADKHRRKRPRHDAASSFARWLMTPIAQPVATSAENQRTEEAENANTTEHHPHHHHSPPSSSSLATEGASSASTSSAGEEQDHEKILLSSLPPLPHLIYRGKYEKASVTVKPNIKGVGVAQNYLRDPVRKHIEKKLSNLKWLLDLPSSNGEYSGVLTNLVIHGKLETAKKDEIWFKVGEYVTRFSKKEFALVSGLNMKKTYDEEKLKLRATDTGLIDHFWPNKNKLSNITCEDLEDALERHHEEFKDVEQLDTSTLNRYAKLIVLLIMSRFMFEGGVDRSTLGIMKKLNFANIYDWGTACWSKMIEQLKVKLEGRPKNARGRISYHLSGCPWVFQAWICESIPSVGKIRGTRKGGVVFPRVAPWEWFSTRTKDEHLKKVLEEIEWVHPTLEPTDAEKQQWYYQMYLEHCQESPADAADPVIDLIADKLKGSVRLYKELPSAMEGIGVAVRGLMEDNATSYGDQSGQVSQDADLHPPSPRATEADDNDLDGAMGENHAANAPGDKDETRVEERPNAGVTSFPRLAQVVDEIKISLARMQSQVDRLTEQVGGFAQRHEAYDDHFAAIRRQLDYYFPYPTPPPTRSQ